jgi:hypothetical protein
MLPTGQLKSLCQRAGYTNAHDYLCGEALGLAGVDAQGVALGQKAMDERRIAKGWGHWTARLGVVPPNPPVPSQAAPAAPAAAASAGTSGASEGLEPPSLRRGSGARGGRDCTPPPPPMPVAAAGPLSSLFKAARAVSPKGVVTGKRAKDAIQSPPKRARVSAAAP